MQARPLNGYIHLNDDGYGFGMKAHEIWLGVRGEPQAAVFLTALLLGKRLYRHG